MLNQWIANYFRRKFEAEKVARWGDSLAKGTSPFSTNQVLRWCTLFSIFVTLVALIIYQQHIYVASNSDYLSYLMRYDRSLYRSLTDGSGLFDENNYYIYESAGIKAIIPLTKSALPLTKIATTVFLKKLLIQKLTMEATGAIIQIICLVRFVILSIRFNIPTSFVMAIIGFGAAYIYYTDMHNMLKTSFVVLDRMHTSSYIRRLAAEVGASRTSSDRKKFSSPTWMFLNILQREMVGSFSLNGTRNGDTLTDIFWNDPMSLTMNRFLNYFADGFYKPFVNNPPTKPDELLDHEWKKARFEEFYKYSLALWYYVTSEITVPIFKWAMRMLYSYRGFLIYTIGARRMKEYMPYLIQHHWTHVFLLTTPFEWVMCGVKNMSSHVETLIGKDSDYLSDLHTWELVEETGFERLKSDFFPDMDFPREGPERNYFIVNMNDLQVQGMLWEIVISWVFLAFMFYFITASFHAAAGQYYYFPLVTPNVELHVGPRKDESMYCAGQASWQDLEDDKVWTTLWHGFFGRGTDKPPVILIVYDFIKGLFVKFFRIFRR